MVLGTILTKTKYVEDKEMKRLRVRTWVEAVLHASGLTLVELEQKYSDAKTINPVARSCIWDKYRNGSVAPRIGIKPNGELHLAGRVEIDYPGTLQWLISPLWRLSDKAPMGMNEIRSIYEGMIYLFKSIFVETEHKTTGVFWRRNIEIEKCCKTLSHLDELTSFIALLTIIKEAEVNQDQEVHFYVFEHIFTYKVTLKKYPELKVTRKWLFEYLKSRWADTGYYD